MRPRMSKQDPLTKIQKHLLLTWTVKHQVTGTCHLILKPVSVHLRCQSPSRFKDLRVSGVLSGAHAFPLICAYLVIFCHSDFKLKVTSSNSYSQCNWSTVISTTLALTFFNFYYLFCIYQILIFFSFIYHVFAPQPLLRPWNRILGGQKL